MLLILLTIVKNVQCSWLGFHKRKKTVTLLAKSEEKKYGHIYEYKTTSIRLKGK